jgi:urease accessory protein
MTQPISEWLTWQVVDSAFPTGMFAHSCGLESAWQHGELAGPDALERFVRSSVLQAGYAAIPLLNAAYHQPGRLAAFDDLSEAFLINAVANRASRVQGRALMGTMMRVWPSDEMTALGESAGRTRAHAAPVTGAAFRTLGVPLMTAQRIALFGAARAVLTAAVRLGIVGSFEAQRLQHGCGPWLDDVAERCADLDADDLAQTAPVIDILQAGHDRLYSRLFQS